MPLPKPLATTDDACPSCTGSGKAAIFLSAPDRYHGRKVMYHLGRCPSCSLVYLANAPAPQDMGQHYGVDYDRSVAAAGEEPERWRERWEDVARLKPAGGAVLDLGCSAGGFLLGLKDPKWKLYGIEMSDIVAEKARERTGAEVFVGDILDAPFAPESFDVITCFHVFEHLYEPRAVLEKVSRWLKPGGVFYAMVPNIDSAGARIFQSYWYALELPRHLFHFSPKSLRKMADLAGLEEVSVITQHELFLEPSVHYMVDSVLEKVGIRRKPLAEASFSFPFRVIRKVFRLTLLPVLNGVLSQAGDGESIHAVFRKTPKK